MTTDPVTPAHPPRAVRALTAGLAVLLVLLSLAMALGADRALGLLLFFEQFLAAMLALALALVFLKVPVRGRRRSGAVPWYDAAASAAGFLCAAYVALRYPELVEQATFDPSTSVVYGGILLVLIVEGLRRTAGMAITTIVVIFLVYGLIADWVPGALAGRALSPDRMLADLMLDSNALLGTPLKVAATVVVAFVFFGFLLNLSGGAAFFTNISLVLMGRYRGGSAKISIVASGLFGSISGSAVSNVVSTGVVTIPLMKRGGFPAHTAGAIEAVASTGGQLMPPIMGASAFLMAEFLDVPYGEVVLAALVPALLYYTALFMQADLHAARAGMSRVPPEDIPSARETLASGWHFPLPFATLVYALFWLNLPPEEAAVYAIVALFALVVLTRVLAAMVGRMPWRDALLDPLRFVGQALEKAGETAVEIIMITAAAGLIIGILNLTGFAFALTLLLVDVGAQSLVLLLLLAAFICMILGMGMPTVSVYVLLAILVAPALSKLGIEPIAAHLFVLYCGMMSMITPPVAIAAFAAATLAEAPAMRTGFEAVRFGWPAYVVPFLFVASPSLLLLGTPLQLVVAAVTAIGGVWLVSVGVAGFFVRPLSPLMRILFAASGLAMMVPAGAFAGALATDITGVAFGIALSAYEIVSKRRLQAGASARSL